MILDRGRLARARGFLRDLRNEIKADNVSNGAAALAYYLMLAAFPAAIFLLTLLPYLPIPNLNQAIMDLLGQAMPEEASKLFTGVVGKVTQERRGGVLSLGALATLWAASSGLFAIMQQLNITYDVVEGRSFIKTRAIAIGLTLVFLILVIGALGLVIFGGVIEGRLASFTGESAVLVALFAGLRWVIIGAALLLAFAIMYYVGPDVEQRFRFISPGAIVGVLLLAAASAIFRFYVARFANYGATYGNIGAVIVLLLWLYMAGWVILLGSEINALVEHLHPEGKSKGEKQEPKDPAVARPNP